MITNEQKVGMLLQKEQIQEEYIGISNMTKSIYLLQPHPLATPIDSTHTHLLLTTLIHSTHSFTIVIHTLSKVKSMDDNCGECVEYMGVVSRRQVWLVGVDGIYGCG